LNVQFAVKGLKLTIFLVQRGWLVVAKNATESWMRRRKSWATSGKLLNTFNLERKIARNEERRQESVGLLRRLIDRLLGYCKYWEVLKELLMTCLAGLLWLSPLLGGCVVGYILFRDPSAAIGFAFICFVVWLAILVALHGEVKC